MYASLFHCAIVRKQENHVNNTHSHTGTHSLWPNRRWHTRCLRIRLLLYFCVKFSVESTVLGDGWTIFFWRKVHPLSRKCWRERQDTCVAVTLTANQLILHFSLLFIVVFPICMQSQFVCKHFTLVWEIVHKLLTDIDSVYWKLHLRYPMLMDDDDERNRHMLIKRTYEHLI